MYLLKLGVKGFNFSFSHFALFSPVLFVTRIAPSACFDVTDTFLFVYTFLSHPFVLLRLPDPFRPSAENNGAYTAVLDAWCPERGHVKVYLLDTGEEASLLQEWIKLRMLRSDTPRIVDAGGWSSARVGSGHDAKQGRRGIWAR